jgi:poly(beta-D-mannuronate) lyase
MSFGIGSDNERTVVPKNVFLFNNLFYNTKDSLLYNVYDSINGIQFAGNVVSKTVKQQMVNGFSKTATSVQKIADLPIPASNNSGIAITDSLQKIGKERLQNPLSDNSGFSNASQLNTLRGNKTGAKWFNVNQIIISKKPFIVNCKSSIEFMHMISGHYKEELNINLTGNDYHINVPININQNVIITSNNKQIISFSSDNNSDYAIKINAGNSLSFMNVQLNLTDIHSNTFIITDTSGNSNHSDFYMRNCQINNGSKTFFSASKSSLCDSIVITNCSFSDNKEAIFKLNAETDKKGYYNVEKLKITNCRFTNNNGQLLALVRSGTDESTMGPMFIFSNNTIKNCGTQTNDPIIHLFGVQQSSIENNNFSNCNAGKVLIKYEDNVSAKHTFRKNMLDNSGVVVKNKWVHQE